MDGVRTQPNKSQGNILVDEVRQTNTTLNALNESISEMKIAVRYIKGAVGLMLLAMALSFVFSLMAVGRF